MSTKTQRLEQNKNQIIAMYAGGEGLSTNAIAKQFDCSSGLVYQKLDEWITLNKTNKIGKATQFKDEILDLFDNYNYSMSQLAIKFNMSIDPIKRLLDQNNRDTSKFRSYDLENKLRDKEDLVKQLHNDGKNIIQISNVVGHSTASVWEMLKKLGLTQPQTKYNVDERFFENIDTQEKAYVLGMMYSDGNVRNDGRLRIALQENDKDVLEKIKNVLKYDGPLYYKEPKNEKSQAQWELSISRKKMVIDLIKLGCIPAKSNVLEFPTEQQVSKQFIWAFIRGVFDGDGSIKINRESTLQCNIVGSFDFIDGLQDLLKSINIECTQYYRKAKRHTSQLSINKNDECVKFLDRIYYNDSISMNRKREKWEWYKNKYNYISVIQSDQLITENFSYDI